MKTGKNIIEIETKRLLLRNILPEDKQFIANLWTNHDVTKYMGGPRNPDSLESDIKENIENPYEEEYDLWILVDKNKKNPVGHCGLLKKQIDGNDEFEIIYVIDKKFWGNGYATEIAKKLAQYAFEEKKLKSVVALIKPENKVSEKVALNIGMKLDREVTRQENIKMFLYRKEGN